MSGAYFFDHPNIEVSKEDLEKIGVLSFKIDADNYEKEGKLDALCKERNYAHRSEICCSRKTLQNYDEMLGKFFAEHFHEFEEIRFILDGSGFFDVRNEDDEWVRIIVKKGDLLVLPAGIYHRFTLDENEYLKAMRLFLATQTEPIWTPINRSRDAERDAVRRDYVVSQLKSEVKGLRSELKDLKRKFEEIQHSNKN